MIILSMRYLGVLLYSLSWVGYILGPIVCGSIYLWKSFWAMANLVGMGWALIWTFPMPLGIGTFPFWAREIYGYSNSEIWFYYIGTFGGLGFAFLMFFIMAALGLKK